MDTQWTDAGEYQFLLDGEEILARTSRGRMLKAVPAKARKLPEYEQLDALRTALAQHRRLCADTVTAWFLRGETVPTRLIAAVWPDPAWRGMLVDAVVAHDATHGLLRDATDSALRLVDLDGEELTVPVADDTAVTLPHPIVLPDLADWREFAVELGVRQGVDQLLRDCHPRPNDDREREQALRRYEGAVYERANALVGRSRGGGFAIDYIDGVSGITLRILEDGVETTAVLHAWESDEESATLGVLSFTRQGREVPAADVGPLTWSEGIRMAEFVYSGRTITEEPK